MKLTIVLMTTLLLSGCGIANLIPDQFDNIEYSQVVNLNVSASINKDKLICTRPEHVYHNAKFLEVYSKGTMNETNQNIYTEVTSLVEELYKRENPSPVYCKLKWGNIEKATEEVIALSGTRIKK